MINKDDLDALKALHAHNTATKGYRKSAINDLPEGLPLPKTQPDQRLRVPLALRAKS